MSLWNKFDSRLQVTAHLVATTGIRVGMSGESALPTATDLPLMRDVNGKAFLPGSSLRGVFRSHIERIVRTFENVGGGKGACDPTSKKDWCIQDKTSLTTEQQIFDRSCRVCQVFGSPWLASRVRITDLPLLNHSEPEIRDGVAIHREKETSENKYDFEVLPVGTRFRLEIIAENLEPVEMGMLLLGLKELEKGGIVVGGFKGRGLGRVTLENTEYKYVDKDCVKNYLLTDEMGTLTETEQYITQFVESLGGESHAREAV
jgi:CRISPR-associated RAMP protein (TIGR02581 family)